MQNAVNQRTESLIVFKNLSFQIRGVFSEKKKIKLVNLPKMLHLISRKQFNDCLKYIHYANLIKMIFINSAIPSIHSIKK